MLESSRQLSQRLISKKLLFSSLALLVIAGISITATGQPAGPTIDAETGQLPTLFELFGYSKLINSIILALSILGLGLMTYFLMTINHQSMVPGDFMEEVTKLVMRKKYEAATDLCRARRGVFVATIMQRLSENADKDPSLLMEIIDTEGRRRADVVWNRISYLSDISNVAPMLGLLGTVLGMIKAFFMLESQSGSIASSMLAKGVGEAMATTMFGLIVAIVTLVFYSIVKARTTRVLADAEQAIHTLADLIHRSHEKSS